MYKTLFLGIAISLLTACTGDAESCDHGLDLPVLLDSAGVEVTFDRPVDIAYTVEMDDDTLGANDHHAIEWIDPEGQHSDPLRPSVGTFELPDVEWFRMTGEGTVLAEFHCRQ